MLLGDSHPWSQTKGPEVLNLTELKLCSRELRNFWNFYFNGVSLGGHMLSYGSRARFWKSSLEQWTCWLSWLVWGSAHSQSHHEVVCLLSGKDGTGSTTTSHRNRSVVQQQGSWGASPGLLVPYLNHSTTIFFNWFTSSKLLFLFDSYLWCKVYVCFFKGAFCKLEILCFQLWQLQTNPTTDGYNIILFFCTRFIVSSWYFSLYCSICNRTTLQLICVQG